MAGQVKESTKRESSLPQKKIKPVSSLSQTHTVVPPMLAEFQNEGLDEDSTMDGAYCYPLGPDAARGGVAVSEGHQRRGGIVADGGEGGACDEGLGPLPVVMPADNSKLGKGFRKGRRWSLDIISPFFQPRHRKSSSPSASNNALNVPGLDQHRLSLTHPQQLLLGGGESAPSPPIFGGLQFPWRRGSNVSFTRRMSQPERDAAYLVVHTKDEGSFVVTVEEDGELRTLVEAARMEKKEERVHSYRVIVAATRQTRASSDSSRDQYKSCDNLLQHLQAVAEHSANTDDRLTVVTELLESEQQYLDSLQVLYEQYAEPLRKFSSLSKEDHRVLFVGLEPIFKLSGSFTEKLDKAVGTWDPSSTKIGGLFSNKFWSKFDEYYDTYEEVKQFLAERLRNDREFENFCNLRQQNGVLSLQALLFLPLVSDLSDLSPLS